MSHKFYVPVLVNNQSVSKEVKEWYFPLLTSGQLLSKKIVKAYCAVLENGQSVSKLFYEAGASASGNWDFYETAATGFLDDYYYRYAQTITKYNDGIAYFAFMGTLSDGRGNYWYYPITVSTDEDGTYIYAKRNGQDIPFAPQTDSVVYNNTTWYYTYDSMGYYLGHQAQYPADYSPDCYINGIPYYDYEQDWFDMETLVKEQLLAKIYDTCFATSYQSGNTYDLPLADKTKTIRKGIGIFLHLFVSIKTQPYYVTLLQNLNTIVSDLVTGSGNDPIIHLLIQYSSARDEIVLRLTHSNGSASNKTLSQYEGLYYHSFVYSPAISWNGYYQITLNYNGTISRTTGSATPDRYIGIHDTAVSVQIGNMGLNL